MLHRLFKTAYFSKGSRMAWNMYKYELLLNTVMSHFPGIFREHSTLSQGFRKIFLNPASLSILKKNLHFLDESEATLKTLVIPLSVLHKTSKQETKA